MNWKTWRAILWTVLILVLCWMPRRSMPFEESVPSLFHRVQIDKLVHCGMFAAFAFLWRRGTGSSSAALIGVSGVALAIITEVGQGTALVGRDADTWDAMADCLGVAIGLVAASVYQARWKPAEVV
jgi:VanZ family protein